jgi:hypothetical protein
VLEGADVGKGNLTSSMGRPFVSFVAGKIFAVFLQVSGSSFVLHAECYLAAITEKKGGLAGIV